MPDGLAGTVSAAWTGDELLIVAPDGESMAAFDLRGDAWEELDPPDLPADLYALGAVWTGDELIVMAYPNGVSARAAGAAWDPMRPTWRELPGSPVVALNAQPAPVWTASEVAVVSRSLRTDPPDGVPPDTTYVSLYDPAANSWRVAGIQDVYLPTGPAVAIGPLVVSRDAIYNVLTDTWLEPPPAPEGAWGAPVVAGDEVIFWGGGPGGESMFRFNHGIRYRPAND